MSNKQMMICPRANSCSKSETCGHGNPHPRKEKCSYDTQECVPCIPYKKGIKNMKETAKNIANSIHNTIKPYEKYIGLVALAVAIDHFLLGNKFTSRFIALGEALVQRITDGLDKVINKLTDGLLEETVEGEDK